MLEKIRFSDTLSEIPENTGPKVHRSHWVAHGKVESIVKEGEHIFLLNCAQQKIPVRKRYRKAVHAAGWLK